jgi:hypothetical protein
MTAMRPGCVPQTVSRAARPAPAACPRFAAFVRLATLVAAGLPLGIFLVPATAKAMDAEVTNDETAQFYDLRSPTGTVLSRRRLTATLGVGAYNLLDAPEGNPKAADLSFRARVRYDADYGASGAETDPTMFASVVPGFQEQLVDLMYAYVEGRRLAGGWLGFKAGRQYVTDVLGWWGFDGAEASITTPYYLKAEVYGGLEERGGMPLGAPRFESDGIWRGNRSNFDPSLYTAFQAARAAPAYAVALESTGVTWIHGRLTYRRVDNTGSVNTSEFASGLYPANIETGTRVSSERIGYAMDASLASLGGAKAGIVYDLYRADITSIYGSLDAYLGRKVTVSADYDYYVPSFDGDSIWNFFAGEPTNDLGLRANVDVNDKLSIAGGGHVRIFSVQTEAFNPTGTQSQYLPSPLYSLNGAQFPTNGHPFDGGGDLRARWRTGETEMALRASGDFGEEGDRVGADINAEHVIETRYVVSGRTGLWQWTDKLQPDRDTTSFNYVLGLGYRFAQRSQAKVEWEHDINGLVGQRFRIMLNLQVAASK